MYLVVIVSRTTRARSRNTRTTLRITILSSQDALSEHQETQTAIRCLKITDTVDMLHHCYFIFIPYMIMCFGANTHAQIFGRFTPTLGKKKTH